jgi:hypothetical protein
MFSPEAGGLLVVSCLELASIFGGYFLHPQPEDAPYYGDKGTT